MNIHPMYHLCAERPPTTSRASTDAITDYCNSSDESDINIDAPDAYDDSASTSVPNVVIWTDLAGNQFTPRFQKLLRGLQVYILIYVITLPVQLIFF